MYISDQIPSARDRRLLNPCKPLRERNGLSISQLKQFTSTPYTKPSSHTSIYGSHERRVSMSAHCWTGADNKPGGLTEFRGSTSSLTPSELTPLFASSLLCSFSKNQGSVSQVSAACGGVATWSWPYSEEFQVRRESSLRQNFLWVDVGKKVSETLGS